LIITRGDLLCWNFIDLLKFQISNSKYKKQARILGRKACLLFIARYSDQISQPLG